MSRWLLVGALLVLLPVPVLSATPMQQKKIDSLFVIASSGEVRFREASAAAVDSLVAMSTDVVPSLVNKLETKSARERVTIISILKRIGSPALPHLLQSLGRSEGLIVERVCNALGEIADSSASDGLQRMVAHPRWQVRDEALAALSKLSGVSAIEAIASGMDDSIGHVRKSAALAAGACRDEALLPGLVRLLDDPFYGARMNAAAAIMNFDTTSAVAVIGNSMLQLSASGAFLACDLLGRLRGEQAEIFLSLELESSEPARRARAARALLMIDSVRFADRVDSIRQSLPGDSLLIRQLDSRP